MWRGLAIAMVVLAGLLCAREAGAQTPLARPKFEAFEVATIKKVDPDAQGGRYIVMQGANRFVEKAYTLKLLIAAAYDLNPKTISGGPGWAETEHYDIVAVTPGEVRPTRNEQMAMLRKLLEERFQLRFHREAREFSMYALEVAKNGAKISTSNTGTSGAGLRPVAPDSDVPPTVGPGVVYPQKIVLPGRNATLGELASLLQRAILDRPVGDRTGLTGRYDFDLEWAPDETQFGGDVGAATAAAPSPPLFVAIEQELGLRLEAMRGPVEALVVDGVERPSAN
jgi:uncharacterized protein (TIGR03435 family)